MKKPAFLLGLILSSVLLHPAWIRADHQVQYFYDWRNQLMKVDDGAGTVIEYTNDALGRRVMRQVTFNGGQPEITFYIYDGWRVLEEQDGDGRLMTRYTYGNALDELIEIEKRDPVSGEMKQYIPMQDIKNWSMLGLADANGNLVERVRYTPYGKPTFIYDHQPPKVDQVRLVGNELRIRFSEPVEPTKALPAISTHTQDGTALIGKANLSDDDRLMTLKPTNGFPQQAITFEITTALEDKYDNHLANTFTQGFTPTGVDQVIYDRGPPNIKRILLLDGTIHVEFDEEIDPASISNCIFLGDNQARVLGAITLDDEKTVVMTPSPALVADAPDSQHPNFYFLGISNLMADLSHKHPDGDMEKTFTYTGHNRILYEALAEDEHETSYVGNTITFQGRDYDPLTGLIYFRNRDYNPTLGRFLQKDPMGYADSMNPYQAFGSNPVNMTDPFGFESGSTFAAIDKASGGPGGQYTKGPDPWMSSKGAAVFGGTMNAGLGSGALIATGSALTMSGALTPEGLLLLGIVGIGGLATDAIGNGYGRSADRYAAGLPSSPFRSYALGFGDTLGPTHLYEGFAEKDLATGMRLSKLDSIQRAYSGAYNTTNFAIMSALAASRTPNRGAVRWVDEGGNMRAGRSAGMSSNAYGYQSGVTGARSNPVTGRSQAPQLEYTDANRQSATVKFDGLEGDVLIDRKISIHTGPKTRLLAQRQSTALTQAGFTGVWEVPSAAEAARATRILTQEGITNITVRIVSR